MEYFTLHAKNHGEAMEKMKNQFGPGARILTKKTVRLGFFRREGVEISGYLSGSPDGRTPAAGSPVDFAPEARSLNMSPLSTGTPVQINPVPVEIEKQKILKALNQKTGAETESSAASSAQTILKEIRSLKEQLVPREEIHPSLRRIEEILGLNDFTSVFIRSIVNRLRQEFSLDGLDDFSSVQKSVVQWIEENIEIYDPKEVLNGRARVIVVVGPTGVGKTTTVAKLAAAYSLGNGNGSRKEVRMVTIDNYKIGAKKQIQTYAEIMQVPFSYAESRKELEKVLNLYQDVDIILIDTIGKSPRDFSKLGEMQSVLTACGSTCETHLAISATTKTRDIVEIMKQFEPFGYCSVILTKLDETSRVGNIISVLTEKRKSLSFITNGQQVPQDIQPASRERLLKELEGMNVRKIEDKFSKKNVDNNERWSM